MIHADTWVKELFTKLQAEFGSRLIYLGLQGSYRRGEATESSDIDIVTVLESMTPDDLERYRRVVRTQPDSTKACGFICGIKELRGWPRYEIFQLVQDTQDYWGVLAELAPSVTRQDIREFVRIGAANLYHELCHRYIYTEDAASPIKLTGCSKSVYYLVLNRHYLRTGYFCRTRAELAAACDTPESQVMQSAVRLSAGVADDESFRRDFTLLLEWCQNILQEE